jgi:hypothetical protein
VKAFCLSPLIELKRDPPVGDMANIIVSSQISVKFFMVVLALLVITPLILFHFTLKIFSLSKFSNHFLIIKVSQYRHRFKTDLVDIGIALTFKDTTTK